MTKHLLTLADLAREEFEAFFKRAVELKQKQKNGNALGFYLINPRRAPGSRLKPP